MLRKEAQFYCENITFYLSLYFLALSDILINDMNQCLVFVVFIRHLAITHSKYDANIYILILHVLCEIQTTDSFFFVPFFALLNRQRSTRWSILYMYSLNT